VLDPLLFAMRSESGLRQPAPKILIATSFFDVPPRVCARSIGDARILPRSSRQYSAPDDSFPLCELRHYPDDRPDAANEEHSVGALLPS